MWYYADWAVDWKVRTLPESLKSNLGADSWRLGEDITEILATFVDATDIGDRNRCDDVAK